MNGGAVSAAHLLPPTAGTRPLADTQQDYITTIVHTDAARYRIKVLRRLRHCGRLACPGDTLTFESIGQAVHVVRMHNGKPADDATALAVELAMRLQDMLPKAEDRTRAA